MAYFEHDRKMSSDEVNLSPEHFNTSTYCSILTIPQYPGTFELLYTNISLRLTATLTKQITKRKIKKVPRLSCYSEV